MPKNCSARQGTDRVIAGKRIGLAGKIQDAYGITKDEAEQRLEAASAAAGEIVRAGGKAGRAHGCRKPARCGSLTHTANPRSLRTLANSVGHHELACFEQMRGALAWSGRRQALAKAPCFTRCCGLRRCGMQPIRRRTKNSVFDDRSSKGVRHEKRSPSP